MLTSNYVIIQCIYFFVKCIDIFFYLIYNYISLFRSKYKRIMKKSRKVILIIMNTLMGLLYLGQAFSVLQTFEFFPWYNEEGSFLMSMALLWVPLCLVTLVNIILRFCFKEYRKSLICIACLNSLYIPCIFALGYVNITIEWIKIIGCVSILTMILYFVLSLIFSIKDRNREFDFKNRVIY